MVLVLAPLTLMRAEKQKERALCLFPKDDATNEALFKVSSSCIRNAITACHLHVER
jgi:hypothetical protein